jgi:hypothetical protein
MEWRKIGGRPEVDREDGGGLEEDRRRRMRVRIGGR